MPDICPTMQKLINHSNYGRDFHGLIKNAEKYRCKTWNDDVLLWNEKTVKAYIETNNNQVRHLQKCKDNGCKELKKNWGKESMKIKNNREDFLRKDQNQSLITLETRGNQDE